MMEIPVDQPNPQAQASTPSSPPAKIPQGAPLIETVTDYWRQLQTFWQVYQKPLSLGFVLLVAGIYAYITVTALLTVLSSLFVVAGSFKLVGFGYSVWFIYRYLLWARNREEFKAQWLQLKAKVLGFAHNLVES
jgi:CAAD domains of cyanobacterial aminoacyl-tRNA synthetase